MWGSAVLPQQGLVGQMVDRRWEEEGGRRRWRWHVGPSNFVFFSSNSLRCMYGWVGGDSMARSDLHDINNWGGLSTQFYNSGLIFRPWQKFRGVKCTFSLNQRGAGDTFSHHEMRPRNKAGMMFAWIKKSKTMTTKKQNAHQLIK